MLNRSWRELARMGRSTRVKNSWIWLVIIPPAAKVAESLNYELPLSWQLGFWSAFAFTLGDFVFRWRCPSLVSDFLDAGEFLERGGHDHQIRSEIYQHGGDRLEELQEQSWSFLQHSSPELKGHPLKERFDGGKTSGERTRQFYEAVTGSLSTAYPQSRALTLACFTIGFTLLLIVGFEAVLRVAFQATTTCRLILVGTTVLGGLLFMVASCQSSDVGGRSNT